MPGLRDLQGNKRKSDFSDYQQVPAPSWCRRKDMESGLGIDCSAKKLRKNSLAVAKLRQFQASRRVADNQVDPLAWHVLKYTQKHSLIA